MGHAPTTSTPDLLGTNNSAPADGCRLILIRHGESVVTVNQVVGGPKTCSGLSELGARQAQALHDRWAAGHEPAVDTLWSSEMPRAVETAEAINQSLGLELQFDVDLEERRPGDADGLTWPEFREQYPDYDHHNPHSELSPGGESAVDFFYRVGRPVDRIIQENQGKTVMIVCHGGVVDVVFRTLLGTNRHSGFNLWTLNTSVTELLTRDLATPVNWQLVRYNDASHLAGLD